MAFAAAMLYLRIPFCTRLDPQVRFYSQFCKNKLAWSEKMTQEHGKKVLFCGGSSCAFSIMGMRLLQQHGLPAVNMGIMAGCESTMLTRFALSEAHPGDTIIIALEPKILTVPYQRPSIACKLSCAFGHSEWVYRLGETPCDHYVRTMIGSSTGWTSLMLLPSFRRKGEAIWHYSISETDASGYQTTSHRLKDPFQMVPYEGQLSEHNKTLLKETRQWCDRNQVRVAYSLPWGYWEPDVQTKWEAINFNLVKQIAAILPVLRDPRMGVYREPAHFTDTYNHLNTEGAALRSDELARQIKAWDVWTPEALNAWEQEHSSKSERR